MKYKCETSLGEVEVSFDPLNVVIQKLYTVYIIGREFECIKNFEWIKGQELVQKLYDYSPGDVHIVKTLNASFWLRVQLLDPYYGAPEYLLITAGESDEE